MEIFRSVWRRARIRRAVRKVVPGLDRRRYCVLLRLVHAALRAPGPGDFGNDVQLLPVFDRDGHPVLVVVSTWPSMAYTSVVTFGERTVPFVATDASGTTEWRIMDGGRVVVHDGMPIRMFVFDREGQVRENRLLVSAPIVGPYAYVRSDVDPESVIHTLVAMDLPVVTTGSAASGMASVLGERCRRMDRIDVRSHLGILTIAALAGERLS